MGDASGKVQGLALDHLQFSASANPVLISLPLTLETQGANLILSWTAAPGQQYQLEVTDDLAAGVWTQLDNPVAGTGAPLSITNTLTSPGQQFFRLRVLP